MGQKSDLEEGAGLEPNPRFMDTELPRGAFLVSCSSPPQSCTPTPASRGVLALSLHALSCPASPHSRPHCNHLGPRPRQLLPASLTHLEVSASEPSVQVEAWSWQGSGGGEGLEWRVYLSLRPRGPGLYLILFLVSRWLLVR